MADEAMGKEGTKDVNDVTMDPLQPLLWLLRDACLPVENETLELG